MYKEFFDITVRLGAESTDYPGDSPFRRDEEIIIAHGLEITSSHLDMSAHAGTHIDTPAHFFKENKSLDDYGINDLVMPAAVIEIGDAESIGAAELSGCDLAPGGAVLFKTENSRSGLCTRGVFSDDYVYLSGDAADIIVEKKLSMAGIDYLSMDRYGDDTYPVHRKLSGAGVIILEGINLCEVPAGNYTLFCIPLRLAGAEASPVRAFLAL